MMLNFIDRLGDWNPQLFREMKGRLKVLSVGIAIFVSLLVQSLLVLFQLGNVPTQEYSFYGEYCGLRLSYEQQRNQLQEQYHNLQNQFFINSQEKQLNLANLEDIRNKIAQTKEKLDDINLNFSQPYCTLDAINFQKWWQDHYGYLFLSLSIIFVFTLFLAGTYLLINDLVKEYRRGTLNFIRLSPQTATSIFIGKLLGVPILIYLVIAIAIPLHIFAGISAGIPLVSILSFWAVLIASCISFYSAGVLFSLRPSWFSGFQPWLGSGLLLLFLIVTLHLSDYPSAYSNYVTSWLVLLSPFTTMAYLLPTLMHTHDGLSLNQLQWFYLPLGSSNLSFVAFSLINYTLCSFWIWQAIKRCFHNPNGTMLTKQQSYTLVFLFEIMIVGFAVQGRTTADNWRNIASTNFILISFYNLVLLMALIIMLSPQLQTLQDWARYRHQENSGRRGFKSLFHDLVKGEKSPALIAISINLIIASLPLLIGIVLLPVDAVNSNIFHTTTKIKLILGVALFFSLMMIYATIFQIVMMLKKSKRVAWGSLAVSSIVLQPIIALYQGSHIQNNPVPWLFSIFSWAGIEYTTTTTIFMAVLAELSVLTLLIFKLKNQLKLAGESATKALISQKS
ncbi:ABC transporter permease [Aetokthonos hydrillicola Thurmond2011]|jgi:hypothetical protein|uniref:ABC transporter permease n=1 Tax=Aetokthonos hydrillicola Thurmond2011 TaxID=2712845 RepID=A0AAP5M9A9_9CYAN|nr:ABC transporter permease [Aetokthonos hydrillicola]MBO3457948.1 ABC transporter permease [Aetokthonos hydrillicola CCALA 1050]MBW4587438.1 ABC transporter permease [Aetokthonos hydrillicola CCALA 1050]MDR9900006.1 ABC transporter permease [Aetokthonos hydrillicola Thurmond2011]